MANFTENGHKATEVLFCANVLGLHHDIFLAAFNIFLSVTASLGNVLILIALHKESSLHPPSKLMFRCLAITDLGVGLITQPVFAAELLFDMKELRQLCNYFYTLTRGTGTVFCGVSLMTVTAISVERLIALSLGLRYRLAREVVTLKRVRAILSFVWLVSVVVSLIDRLSSSTISSKIVSAIIIVFNNLSLLLHEDLLSPPPSSSSNANPCSPRATERRRNSTEHSKISKNCLCSTVGPNNFSRLLSSASFCETFWITFFSQ